MATIITVLVAALVLGAGWFGFSRWFWLGPKGHYFDSNGVPIHYTDEGSGDPVVLVHGFGATGHLNWRFAGVVKELAKQFRVVTIDVRGHGRSGKPAEVQAYGEQMVEDVVRLLDHLNIKRAHLAGYSMGGFITLKLLTVHPERVIRAAVCGFGWQRPDPSALNVYDLLGSVFRDGVGFAALSRFLDPESSTGPLRAAVVDLVMGALLDKRAVGALARSLGKITVTEPALREIEVPVLSVIGTEDTSLRPGVDALIGVLRHHQVTVIADGTHRTTPIKPQFRVALRNWFAADSRGITASP